MSDAYAADPEPTLYQKNNKFDLKYEDISDDGAEMKHLENKQNQLIKLCDKLHLKMKFFQDCGFNLLIFGVGSKRDFLNIFLHEQIRMGQ